jgi:hypothetical protein
MNGSGNAFQQFHQFFQLGLKHGLHACGNHKATHRPMWSVVGSHPVQRLLKNRRAQGGVGFTLLE